MTLAEAYCSVETSDACANVYFRLVAAVEHFDASDVVIGNGAVLIGAKFTDEVVDHIWLHCPWVQRVFLVKAKR